MTLDVKKKFCVLFFAEKRCLILIKKCLMVFESKLVGFESPKFDPKTIKHFFIKHQTSLFRKK